MPPRQIPAAPATAAQKKYRKILTP
jgi:hypothetical protein